LECKPAFGAYKKDPFGCEYPHYHAQNSRWSVAFLRSLVKGDAIPQIVEVRGPSLFDSVVRSTFLNPDFHEEQHAMIKQEKEMEIRTRIATFAQTLKNTGTVIDIADSPPKKAKRADVDSITEAAKAWDKMQAELDIEQEQCDEWLMSALFDDDFAAAVAASKDPDFAPPLSVLCGGGEQSSTSASSGIVRNPMNVEVGLDADMDV
jgi:hypothetical protein